MRGMPFELQGKGGLDVVVAQGGGGAAAAGEVQGGVFWSFGSKRKRGLVKEGLEPRSVLDQRRSPSPPTSTSTLSSSLGGGAASSDTAGVAAVSDSNHPPARKWPPLSDSTPSSAPQGGAERKEDWAAELQPITAALEPSLVVGDRCGGLGMDDWEAMLGESAAASPGQEQTFLRWIMGEIDDPAALKQQQQQHPLLSLGAAADFDAGSAALGFGFADPGFGLEPLSSLGGAVFPPYSAPVANYPLPPTSNAAVFASIGGNNNGGSRGVPSVQSSQTMPTVQFPSIRVPSFGGNRAVSNLGLSASPANYSLSLPLSLPPGMFLQENMEEKPQVFGPGLLLNQHQQQSHPSQNPSFFLPLPPSYAAAQPDHDLLLPPQPKRHQALSATTDPTCQLSPKIPFQDSSGGGQELFLRRNQPQAQQQPGFNSPHGPAPYHIQHRPMKPKVAGDEAAASAAAQQQQALVDQLFKAAELVEAGNSVGAREILARLNHQLPSFLRKPLLRSALYFKEALHLLLHSSTNPSNSSPPPLRTTSPSTPLDIVHKLSAYKAFSEVSPILHFANFTCIQALLEELGASDRIHIVDFDIGIGGQWSSFMQELAQRRCTVSSGATPIFLKITAFISLCSYHPLELHLTRDNLSHFAAELNIPFEFNVLPIDSFDPTGLLATSVSTDEAFAVNLPVTSAFAPPVPALLRLVKQLSPKIVVSVDQGGDRSDLSFSHHFLHALQSSVVLLDSIDAAGTAPDVAHRIERFLLQPRIEGAVVGRYRADEKALPWRTLYASIGFEPVQFSNFTETQAECLIKRVQVRGFHVEKRQAALVLYWQRSELASVSAWRC